MCARNELDKNSGFLAGVSSSKWWNADASGLTNDAMVLGRGLRSASWRRWWFCGSLRAQQHAKTEARGDRVMQLMLAAIADAVPLLKEGSRNMVVSCGVQGETRTAVALVPSPSLLMTSISKIEMLHFSILSIKGN